ncbi:tripartite ATP-independent periplasmic transporter, DctQ component [Citreicella sp. SE45]|nr:tripartite ATP-independent periplasmic transporter, DctQ component [Citreicella sp. SE45]
MHALLKISDIFDAIGRRIGQVGAWMILPMILIIVYDVVTRKITVVQQFVLNSALNDYISPTKLQEAEWHLHAVIFLLAYGLAYLNGIHVRVDLWREARSDRTKAWVEVAALLVLGIPYVCVLIWASANLAHTSFLQGEGSSAMTGIPHRWIIKSFVPLGATVLLMALLSTLIRLGLFLSGPAPLRREAGKRLGMLGIAPAAISERKAEA